MCLDTCSSALEWWDRYPKLPRTNGINPFIISNRLKRNCPAPKRSSPPIMLSGTRVTTCLFTRMRKPATGFRRRDSGLALVNRGTKVLDIGAHGTLLMYSVRPEPKHTVWIESRIIGPWSWSRIMGSDGANAILKLRIFRETIDTMSLCLRKCLSI